MAAYKYTILSTRPVDELQVQNAMKENIGIDTLSFIETTAIHDIETQQEIEWASTEEAIVVFTSMNAADAVTDMLDGFVPGWRIYCMGHTTQQRITEYFGEDAIAGTADNASALADEIIANDESEDVIFFCGNKRRDELPGKLRANNIEVTEITVYETTLIEHTIEKKYDGVLFFSPSAVESFFKKNTLPETTVVFAIGDTTARTVHTYCANKIITAKHPGKDGLMEQAIAYFS